MVKFTEYLIKKYEGEFKVATTHSFLEQAGRKTISTETLTRWLRQDYLYAFIGYVKFASLLLSRIPIATSPPSEQSTERTRTLARAVPFLTYSLSNIVRESSFFVATAEENGLALYPNGVMPDTHEGSLLGPYEEATRGYVDFLIATAAGGLIEEGFVALWAMEKAYFTSWSYAKTFVTPSSVDQTPTQIALEKFMDNWTNCEFAGFVRDSEEIVDGLGIDADSESGKRCETVFQRIVELEQRFWPEV